MLFQINDLTQSFTELKKGRFSLKEFTIYTIKFLFLGYALIHFTVGIYFYATNPDAWNKVIDDWNYGEEEIRQQYYDDIEVFKATGKSYQEFREYTYNKRVKGTKFSILWFNFLWLICIFIACLVPLKQPVRADRANGMLYTWRWGRLYAASLKHFSYELQKRSRFLSIREGGPLIVALSSADGKVKNIKLGTYPSQIQRQNKALLDIIHAFAKHEFDFPEDFTPKKGFLERFTFWRLKFPKTEKLDKAINEWKDSRGMA